MKRLKEVYIKNNDMDEAVAILQKLMAVNENDYELFEELMLLLYKAKKYDEVLNLSKLITRYPNADICNIQNIIAKVYIRTDKIEDSMSLLNDILQQYPGNMYLRQTLAQAYVTANKFDSAVALYLDLIANADISKTNMLRSNLSSVYCSYGVYRYKNKNYQEAFEKFATALEYDDTNADVYYHIGYCNALIKNYTEAINNLKKSIEIEPTKNMYKSLLATIYFELGDIAEAVKLYEDILSTEPQNMQALVGVGIIYQAQNNHEKAIKSFKTVLMKEPNNTDIRYNLALCYEYIRHREAAIEEYETVLEINPEHQAAATNLNMLKSSMK